MTVPALVHMYEQLTRLADLNDMELLWQRTVDWQPIRGVPNGIRGGGSGEAATDEQIADRIGDAAAARYHDEVASLVKRLSDDAARLVRIHGIVLPAQPRKLQGREMLETQVGAEGWCVSCWRNDQHLVPIELRPTGEPYYRDLCRFCGGWKAEHKNLPPMDVLQRRHDGRRVIRKAG